MTKPGFDSLTLCAVCDELQRFVGGRVQGVRQPQEHQVIFEIYRPGAGEARWLFDCSASWARTHLTATRPPNPQSPPAFCAALRKFIDGGQILAIEQRGFDRILDVAIRGFEGQDYLFSAEFMGRHSNLILLGPDEDGRKIVHAAKLITSRLSRVREVLPGKTYIAPPAPNKLNPLEHQTGQLDAFLGISPFLKSEIAARTENLGSESAAITSVFEVAREHAWQPVSLRNENGDVTGAYPIELQSWSLTQQEKRDSLSVALDEYYSSAVPGAALENERRTLSGVLEKVWTQRAQTLAQIEHGQGESSRAVQMRRQGDLILANLWQIEAGQGSAIVQDYFQDPPMDVTITLDADLSPQQNATALFDRARHAEQGAARLSELHEKTAREIEVVAAAREALAEASSLETIATLREQFAARGWLNAVPSTAATIKSAARPDFEGKKVRTFTSPEGWLVFVGDNAEANDYLVQRIGQPNDWWLHLRAGTSAHAIIRTNNAPLQVPHSVLLFAARLVVQRSAAKHAGMVAVDYTLKKYVRKPRRAAPGSVLYTNEKTLHVGADA